MDTVTLYHPDLPDQPIEVPKSAVPHHAASGWSLEPPAPPPDGEAETPADAPPADGAADEPPPTAKKTAAKKTAAAEKGD